MLDSPERVEIGSEQVLGPPDRMILRERTELVFLLGKDLLHQLLEPWSNSVLPQQASAKMKPPCSTNSRKFCLASCENWGADGR